jgi:hypothetical protein
VCSLGMEYLKNSVISLPQPRVLVSRHIYANALSKFTQPFDISGNCEEILVRQYSYDDSKECSEEY